jgi:hypothetical protein
MFNGIIHYSRVLVTNYYFKTAIVLVEEITLAILKVTRSP